MQLCTLPGISLSWASHVLILRMSSTACTMLVILCQLECCCACKFFPVQLPAAHSLLAQHTACLLVWTRVYLAIVGSIDSHLCVKLCRQFWPVALDFHARDTPFIFQPLSRFMSWHDPFHGSRTCKTFHILISGTFRGPCRLQQPSEGRRRAQDVLD